MVEHEGIRPAIAFAFPIVLVLLFDGAPRIHVRLPLQLFPRDNLGFDLLHHHEVVLSGLPAPSQYIKVND